MSFNRNDRRGGRGRPQGNYSGGHSRFGRGRGRGPRRDPSFDPSRLVAQSNQGERVEKIAYQPVNSFVDFKFVDVLHDAIVEKGYTIPTPIQDQAILPILEEKDVIGLAGTGTGKTAAFLLPLIHQVHQNPGKRVLIIAPTRELAIQIRNELDSFTNRMQMFATLCIGGMPLHRQVKSLQRKPEFVIGTPGRIIDLQKRKKLFFGDFSTVVLDEVDRMFDMGFMNDMKYIIQQLPQDKHALFFSATLPSQLQMLAQSFMQSPIKIEVEKQTAAANVTQEVIRITSQSKVRVLQDLLIKEEFQKVLVFGKTKHGLNQLEQTLERDGFHVASIHGNKNQSQRQRALQRFKENKIQVLLATDIASRGLDIDNVTHVINYDLPQTYEDYIHRIGRTGRANNLGVAVSFVG